ncbi:MAG: hypothetical protein EVA89_01040 [Sandaracinaceae bacterium]|nr:MAG: hypothetical protein EVA89_01040 [Sandaracinaceae bacterium]
MRYAAVVVGSLALTCLGACALDRAGLRERDGSVRLRDARVSMDARLPGDATPPDTGVVVRDGDVTPLDAGGDAGATPDSGRCGAACDCAEAACGDTCTCPPACPCARTCSGDCTLTCIGGASCALEAQDESNVEASCSGGASCVVDGRGSDNVTVTCGATARCSADCTDTSNCTMRCAGGDCLLDCTGADLSNCRIEDCPGAVTRCGSSATFVCGRSCPP